MWTYDKNREKYTQFIFTASIYCICHLTDAFIQSDLQGNVKLHRGMR